MPTAESFDKFLLTKSFQQLISDLRKKFKPNSILLFGSRAQGTAKKNSDYDLVLIFENLKKPRLSIEQDIYQHISGRGLNVDILVYSKNQFDDLGTEFGSLPYEIKKAYLEL